MEWFEEGVNLPGLLCYSLVVILIYQILLSDSYVSYTDLCSCGTGICGLVS